MCSYSGRIWSAKRPGKVAMLSNASDPQIKVAMQAPEKGAAKAPGFQG
jgi:hypothetical protein